MHNSFITLIFRWLDVAVIAGGAIYGIRRWVIPFLKEEKKREQERWADLDHKIATYTKEVQRLDMQMNSDRLRAAHLEQKVMLWQALSVQEMRVKKSSQEIFRVNFQEKQDLKNRYIAQLFHDKYIANKAIEQAEIELQERFKDPLIAQQELYRAIVHLKESAT